MNVVRGKMVTFDGHERFFPAIPTSASMAFDSMPEDQDEDEQAQEAHDAAMAHIGECTGEQATELQGALDRRAGARDRKARDKKARDEQTDAQRAEAYRRARDGEIDHRKDFEPAAADAALAHDAKNGSATGHYSRFLAERQDTQGVRSRFLKGVQS